jgi:hypothetical protein
MFRRNCLLKRGIEGKIEGMRREGRRRKHYWMTLRKKEAPGI